MKAKELRIGNWIENVFHKEKQQVCHNIIRWIALEDNPQDYQPVPLTEDILLKCGFVFVKEVGWFFEDVFKFAMNENFELDWYEHAPLKHLHQLQNLYFALTGEELTFNND